MDIEPLNPYNTPNDVDSDALVLGQSDCPICATTHSRLRLLNPILRCTACGVRLWMRVPMWLTILSLTLVSLLALLAYFWVMEDPIRFLDHIGWFMAAPFIFMAYQVVTLFYFGTPYAAKGMQPMSTHDVMHLRQEYIETTGS